MYFVVTNQNKSSGTTTKRSLVDMLSERSVSDVYAQSKVMAKSIAGRIAVPAGGEFREIKTARTVTLPVATDFDASN